MYENKISVVINTYNASRHLEDVLESVKGFDEIVVCDMESTDNTLEIAQKYNCKIVSFPKGNHTICEPARNFAIHSATYPWVLVVDADELVTESLKDYLYQKVNTPGFKKALRVCRTYMFFGKAVHGHPDYQLRFIYQPETNWPPQIHSIPETTLPVENIPSNRKDLYLIHLDDSSARKRFEKFNNYSDKEIDRRINKKYGIFKCLTRPLWFFIRDYFLSGKILDGKRGLIAAYQTVIYQMIILTKHYERTLRRK